MRRWLSLMFLLGLLAGALAAGRWLAHRPRPTPGTLPILGGLFGEVHDKHGPATGARVRYQGDGRMVHTDRDGRFRLPLRSNESARVTAWKEGHFIAGARADTSPLLLRLTPLPTHDNEDYAWVDPTPDPSARHNCGNCHGEIHREWATSGHARSATGRHFLNLYDGSDWHGRRGAGWGLLDQHPDGAGVCTACHAPTVPATDPAYFDLRLVRGVPARGVHCDHCHKIEDAGLGTIGLTHGRFGLKLLRPSEGQLFFGPLDDVDRGEDVCSPLYRDSRYCASCHEGTVFGVHVYSTYSEWLESPARAAGQHCQGCHMAPTGRMTNIAPGKGGIERDPRTLGNHRFFDGSREEMLRDCLSLEVELDRSDGGVTATVEVRAEGVGHRVPTGFIDRHLLLVVEAVGTDGRPLHATGGPLLPSAAGEGLSGQPGRLFAKLLRDPEGRSPVPFWRAGSTALDTRLAPGRPERTTFTFPPQLDRVRVRLIYRRFWQEVAAVKHWPDDALTVIDRTVRIRQSH